LRCIQIASPQYLRCLLPSPAFCRMPCATHLLSYEHTRYVRSLRLITLGTRKHHAGLKKDFLSSHPCPPSLPLLGSPSRLPLGRSQLSGSCSQAFSQSSLTFMTSNYLRTLSTFPLSHHEVPCGPYWHPRHRHRLCKYPHSGSSEVEGSSSCAFLALCDCVCLPACTLDVCFSVCVLLGSTLTFPLLSNLLRCPPPPSPLAVEAAPSECRPRT